MAAASESRWQSLFQQSSDALFLLDRRRRVRFVNAAWEKLAGVMASEVRGLACRRRLPASSNEPLLDILGHVLAPPPEVLAGQTSRARRLLPSKVGACWWDVDFLPIFKVGGLLAILGRAVQVPTSEIASHPSPLPEKLIALRERVVRRDDRLHDAEEPTLARVTAGLRLASEIRAPVLLVGESGTGKRTLARMIHFRSTARERSFAALDATRLPPPAIAAVLFDERFGTVYVREPAALSRDLQLRLAESLGAAADERTLPRIIAGCRTDPMSDVREGRLLGELHALLAAVTIPVPPVRERLNELPRIVEHILARTNEEGGRTVTGLAAEAWEIARSYTWPGNLRELFAVLSGARARCKDDMITVADLPAPVRLAVRLAQTPQAIPVKPLQLEKLLEETERRLIRLALKKSAGNLGRAAESLGMWRQRLVRRMEALGLSKEAGDEPAAES